jgi:two-component system sensor histidine kinase SenX3
VPAGAYVALLLDDTTEARRVDAVRRDFVANVSHELKTPVGAIALLAEAIAGSGDDDATARSFAERLSVESTRLVRLVEELIDLSRLQGAEPMERADAVLVKAFVDEAVDRGRLTAEAARIEVAVSVEPPDLTVRGDERQLATAVANLLDNAVAYSPRDTRVTVSARPRGDEVDVSVTDQGIGIAPADQERVFERFYRVDPARSRETGGTGLGLAIVKNVAANHGGRVDVWSLEGTGSTFTLTLPAGAPMRAPA